MSALFKTTLLDRKNRNPHDTQDGGIAHSSLPSILHSQFTTRRFCMVAEHKNSITGAQQCLVDLATTVSTAQRVLIRRYLENAIEKPERRKVRATNAHFASLMSDPSAAALLVTAGWQGSSDDAFEVFRPDLLQHVLAAIDAAAHCRRSLLTLPQDLLCSVLGLLDSDSVCTMRRVCKTAKDVASRGALWRPFCSPRHWPLSAIPEKLDGLWFRVARLESLWARLEARSQPALRFSLNRGCALADVLAVVPTAQLLAMPLDVLASLLVHDGQLPSPGERLGLFFGGARLLPIAEMLAEMPREARDAASLSPPRLPLTDRVGFGMQLVCDENGAVVFESGFNSIRKARSWAAFLELVLQDTV